MQLRRVRIKNFRALRDVSIDFDEITTFIGPNGGGKSTILRALDWFFNGAKNALDDTDVCSNGNESDSRVEVEVVFDNLTPADRSVLGDKYAPAAVDTFSAWRVWDKESEKFTGKAKAFPSFEIVRELAGASEKKAAYNALRSENPDLNLPPWGSSQTVGMKTMDDWERENPDKLADAWVSDSHLFGFNGQHRLAEIFDYVLVAADLRASEESSDSRGSTIARIVDKSVDKFDSDKAIAELAAEYSEKQAALVRTHLSPKLEQLADDLTEELANLVSDRSVAIEADPVEIKSPTPRLSVSIDDSGTRTSVDRQGHGLQRALLISCLKFLATQNRDSESDSSLFLAIEEPELFQHPASSRLFASVLRRLASDVNSRMQVAYATHSPYFIEPAYYHQIRRVGRDRTSDSRSDVFVRSASVDQVRDRVANPKFHAAVVSKYDALWRQNLSEAFFADLVVLVEGDSDKSILEGLAARTRELELDRVAVAASGGKESITIPNAILEALGVPTYIIFDGDAGARERMEQKKDKKEEDIVQEERSRSRINRSLLTHFDCTPQDLPGGIMSERVVVLPDTMETQLKLDWPAWAIAKQKLIENEEAGPKKNTAAYLLAAKAADEEPGGLLGEIVPHLRNFAAKFG